MTTTMSQVDPDKLPGDWASYLEKVRKPHEPVGDGHVLNSGCSQKLSGTEWRFGNCVDHKER